MPDRGTRPRTSYLIVTGIFLVFATAIPAILALVAWLGGPPGPGAQGEVYRYLWGPAPRWNYFLAISLTSIAAWLVDLIRDRSLIGADPARPPTMVPLAEYAASETLRTLAEARNREIIDELAHMAVELANTAADRDGLGRRLAVIAAMTADLGRVGRLNRLLAELASGPATDPRTVVVENELRIELMGGRGDAE